MKYFVEKLTSNYKLALRTLIEFSLCAVLLGVACFTAYCKVDTLLTEALEESVARQAKTVAFGLEQQFEQELTEMQGWAHLAEQGKVDVGILEEDNHSFVPKGKITGILDKRGNLITGQPMPKSVFDSLWTPPPGGGADKLGTAIKTTFWWKDTIKELPLVQYRKDMGLIFAVPIHLQGQDCILYVCYEDEALRNKFKAFSYNGDGTVILLNSRKDWTVIADGLALINTHSDMQSGWDRLGTRFLDDDGTLRVQSGAVLHNFHGEGYFVYFSLLSEKYNLAISGYAPWASVAVGIDYIYTVMLIAFGFMALFIIMGMRYLMRTRESKSLRREKEIADSANQAKSDFLSNMSHEIRTPINAIMGLGEMVLRESKEPQTLEYTRNSQNAARNLLGLVNDILDFSKIEAGKMDIIPVDYALSSLLNDLVTMSRQRAEKKGLDFIVEASPDLPSMLYGDEIRIKQVITNILTNAVKYTEQGSVTLAVNHKPIENDKVLLCVSVRDTGIGIKEEDMKKLFSAFERIEEKRNRSIEGTGLGMNITKQLLALMGTKLQVESTYGEGSTFSFQLEQKVVDASQIGDFEEAYRRTLAQHQEYHEQFTAPEARILVVDDTPVNLTVAKGLLRQTKVQVETAESGRECLALVGKNHYDLIFLDHRMPEMDGIETLENMKAMEGNPNQETPVISLTANAISGAREQYIAAGFVDYLTKPIDSAKLESLLIKYLPQEKVHLRDEETIDIPAEENLLPLWLSDVKDIDMQAGLGHCGSEAAYLEALKVFAESIQLEAEAIERYFQEEDWPNYTIKVHALKSTARIIGAGELSELARSMEEAGNAGEIEKIKDATMPLLSLYRSFSEKLASLSDTSVGEDADKPLIDEETMAEAFDTLREFVQSFSYDNAMFVLDSLSEYRLPEKEGKLYQELKEAITRLEWEKAAELLRL